MKYKIINKIHYNNAIILSSQNILLHICSKVIPLHAMNPPIYIQVFIPGICHPLTDSQIIKTTKSRKTNLLFL